jgi:hypothetical protein
MRAPNLDFFQRFPKSKMIIDPAEPGARPHESDPILIRATVRAHRFEVQQSTSLAICSLIPPTPSSKGKHPLA